LSIYKKINLFFISANDIRDLAFIIMTNYGNGHDDAGVQCRQVVLGNRAADLSQVHILIKNERNEGVGCEGRWSLRSFVWERDAQ
jgi:hypothetical protein